MVIVLKLQNMMLNHKRNGTRMRFQKKEYDWLVTVVVHQYSV